MAAGNPIVWQEGSRGKGPGQEWGAQTCNVAGVPGAQREDASEIHFCGISCLQEIVLPGFRNNDEVLRNSCNIPANLDTAVSLCYKPNRIILLLKKLQI